MIFLDSNNVAYFKIDGFPFEALPNYVYNMAYIINRHCEDIKSIMEAVKYMTNKNDLLRSNTERSFENVGLEIGMLSQRTTKLEKQNKAERKIYRPSCSKIKRLKV